VTFNNTLKLKLATYPSLYANRAAVMNDLFCSYGNGLRWYKGEVCSGEGNDTEENMLAMIDRHVGSGKHKQAGVNRYLEHLPIHLKSYFERNCQVPSDIEERLVSTEYTSWEAMSSGYYGMAKVPDDCKPDWLNAIWECCNLLIASKVHASNVKIAKKVLVDLARRWPKHKFENNPIPTFNSKAKLGKGVQPWPLDGTPGHFETMVLPFVEAIKFAYTMTRTNEGKNIPYDGYDIGRSEKAGSYGPEQTLSAGNLKYSKEEQCRDALTEILGLMMQIGIEQGRRMALNDVLERLGSHFTMEHFRTQAMKDPRGAARIAIMDRMDAGEPPYVDESNPIEVEEARKMFSEMSSVSERLDRILKGNESVQPVEEKSVEPGPGFVQPTEPLNMKKRISATDFNAIIRRVYNHEGTSLSDPMRYKFEADEQTPNDSIHEFTVTGEWDENDEETMRLFHERGYGNMPMTTTLLNDLCRRKLIKKGTYIIKVAW